MDNLGKVVQFPQTEAHDSSKAQRSPSVSAQTYRPKRRRSDLTYSPDLGPMLVIALGAVFWIVLARWFL